jgi:hypothetical protein
MKAVVSDVDSSEIRKISYRRCKGPCQFFIFQAQTHDSFGGIVACDAYPTAEMDGIIP